MCTGVWAFSEVDEAMATEPEVLLVDATESPEMALLVARMAADEGATVLLLGPPSRSLMLVAVRAGCKDVLDPAHPEQLLEFLGGLERLPIGALTACLGAQAGCGVTTVAIALADFLARRGERIALVDMDAVDRGLAPALGLNAHFTARDLARSVGKVDATRLRGVMEQSAGNFWVLPQGRGPRAKTLNAEDLPSVLAALRHAFDHVVVDVGSALDESTQRVCFDATAMVLLTTTEDASLQGAAEQVGQLRSLGIADHNMHLVLNRHSGGAVDALRDRVGLPVAQTITDDPRTAALASRRRLPAPEVNADTDFVHDLDDLAQRLLGEAPHPRPKPRRWPFWRR
jgi:Flp pilus assembly CpaE family ATPase